MGHTWILRDPATHFCLFKPVEAKLGKHVAVGRSDPGITNTTEMVLRTTKKKFSGPGGRSQGMWRQVRSRSNFPTEVGQNHEEPYRLSRLSQLGTPGDGLYKVTGYLSCLGRLDLAPPKKHRLDRGDQLARRSDPSMAHAS